MELREQIARAIHGHQTKPNDDLSWSDWLPEADAVMAVLSRQKPASDEIGHILDLLRECRAIVMCHRPSGEAFDYPRELVGQIDSVLNVAATANRTEDEAYRAWYLSQMRVEYHSRWAFAKAAWLARASLSLPATEPK